MPQSKDLASESGAMRKLEAAFLDIEKLPAKARARVLRWVREVHLDGADEPADTQ